VFVTGTDTGIGKTVVSACLVRRWDAEYWKPAQTGLDDEEGDSTLVARLSGAAPERIHAPRWALRASLSPEEAGRLEGISIRLEDFVLPKGTAPLVVEGAGGVLVPLGGGATMADLMQRCGLPALIVARSTLGTINHTLLSIEALRARAIPIAGVVMVGSGGEANAEAIARLGGVEVLARIPRLPVVTPASVAEAALALPPAPPHPTMGQGEPGLRQ
jgi:malonyl-CoA O-methyltransferase